MAGAPVTPKYIGQTIGIGGILRYQQYGRYISIIAATPATITLSIDDENPQQIVSGTQIDCEDYKYSTLTFVNTGGAPVVLVALVSNTKVSDMRGDALLAAIAASLAAIDIDTSGIRIDVNAVEDDVEAGNLILTDIETHAGDIDTAIDNSTIAVSTDGGFEVLTPNAATAANGADQACREAMFWTADDHIHFKLGTTDADGTTTLLIANVPISIPIHNTNHLRFYNGAGVASTGINIIWRN